MNYPIIPVSISFSTLPLDSPIYIGGNINLKPYIILIYPYIPLYSPHIYICIYTHSALLRGFSVALRKRGLYRENGKEHGNYYNGVI